MKFSILMINYNNDKTLERAIRSALDQDYPDIEVICVDDASTDRSREIIKSFKNNEKFTAVYHEKNSGMTCGRLSGIERASGDYVLFLDSDDMLMSNCCSTLAKVLQRKKYDMVAFGTEVEYTQILSQVVMREIDECFIQICAELDTESYRRAFYGAFYKKRPINHSICNKCYSIEFVRKIAEKMYNDYINMAEDLYFNFVAGQYVHSYFGIPDKLLRYSFGEGITGTGKYTVNKLVQIINSSSNALRRCREFAHEQNLGDNYFKFISMHEHEFIFYFLEHIKLIPEVGREDVYKLIIEKCGTEQLIETLSIFYKNSFDKLTTFVDLKKLFPFTRKSIKTVGLYYFRLDGDSVENTFRQTSELLIKAGYLVVIITDDENPIDYPLPNGMKHTCLGVEGHEPGKYAIRYQKLRDCILDNEIDLYISNAFYSELEGLDMCTVKSTGCAYVPFCRGAHITSLIDDYIGIIDKQTIYRYADGIITLYSLERIFWSRINSHVFQVNNPLQRAKTSAFVAESRKRELLWVCLTDDKHNNPLDAIDILYLVLQRIGDVNLRICGNMGEDTEKILRKEAEILNVSEYVIFEGYVADLTEFYSKASLLLATSDFEGFNTIRESLAFGLPIVCYELPYITTIKHSGAVVSVPWKNLEAAADAVVGLLLDNEKRNRMSEAAINWAETFMNIDMVAKWKEIISSISEEKKIPSPSEEEFWEYCATSELAHRQIIKVVADLHSSLYVANTSLAESNRALDKANEQLKLVYFSKRYKIGNLLLYFPSKIKGAIWCLRNRGLRYTLSLAMDKFKILLNKLTKKHSF